MRRMDPEVRIDVTTPTTEAGLRELVELVEWVNAVEGQPLTFKYTPPPGADPHPIEGAHRFKVVYGETTLLDAEVNQAD